MRETNLGPQCHNDSIEWGAQCTGEHLIPGLWPQCKTRRRLQPRWFDPDQRSGDWRRRKNNLRRFELFAHARWPDFIVVDCGEELC